MAETRSKAADFAELRSVTGEELRALVGKSPEIGARLVESAAKYGIVAAQLTWARMLLHGEGVTADPAAAFRWFKAAAESGDPEAINMVGRCYELGWGVDIDTERAAEFYRTAARQNFAWGQYNLGQVLLAGTPTAERRREGLGWHLLAAKAGHAKSMNVVGRFCEEGWDVPKSAANALSWYRKSAEGGDYWGQFNLGRMLADRGDGPSAAEWIKRAAETGNEEFVGSILPALLEHPEPILRAIGEELSGRRRMAETPQAKEESGARRRQPKHRAGKGWFGRKGASPR